MAKAKKVKYIAFYRCVCHFYWLYQAESEIWYGPIFDDNAGRRMTSEEFADQYADCHGAGKQLMWTI